MDHWKTIELTEKKERVKLIMNWTYSFLRSNDLPGFINRTRQYILITGKKYRTEDVSSALELVKKSTNKSGIVKFTHLYYPAKLQNFLKGYAYIHCYIYVISKF